MVTFSVLLGVRVAVAEPIEPTLAVTPRGEQSEATPASDLRLEEAKAEFRNGVALLDAGDVERALEAFLRSRERVPSAKNTVNAAICLERLHRYDEALELYETVLVRFASQLDADDRASLGPVLTSLRKKIGYLELSSNVTGLVVVDGRARGRLPLATALRLLPGTRRVRVVQDGYVTFERTVAVFAGQTLALDAELEPLAGSGALRIESTNETALEVTIDGKDVGATPFEGTLPAGAHVLATHAGEIGTAPVMVDVLSGRTELVRVEPKPLGGPITLVSAPRTAELFLARVPLGRGVWHGRLPLGSYAVSVHEAGYFDREYRFAAPPPAVPLSVAVALRKNPNDPRWPRAAALAFELGALVGPWFAPTLAAGSEASCPSACAESRAVWGVSAAATAGLRHQSGWGGELVVGYTGFEQSFWRVKRQSFQDQGTPALATFLLHQRETAAGMNAALRGTLRKATPWNFDWFGALGAGLYVAHYRTTVTGSVFSDDGAVPAVSSGPAGVWGVSPYVSTAFGVEKRVTHWVLRGALAAMFFPTRGPAFGGPTIGVTPNCDPQSAGLGAVGCTPQSSALARERAHGDFWALAPELGATYSF